MMKQALLWDNPCAKTNINNAHTTIVENTDCLSLLALLDNASVDLIATDPPYLIDYTHAKWNDGQDQLNWVDITREFARVLKPSGSIALFQGWSAISNTKPCFDKHFTLKNWIIYDRIKGRGTTRNLVSTREDILWYVKTPDDYTYNKIPSTIRKKTGGSIGKRNGNPYRALSNVWSDISPIVPWSPERVDHPTQKPLALMERIINLFSNTGDVVLDPFAGSGTTLVAAKKSGRNYIGGDINKTYIEITIKRLSDV